jgi:sugar transferase EpsL
MYRVFGKRLLDLILTSLLLSLFSPLLVILVLLVRFKFGSPILFRQKRPGLHGQPFILFKFRTMIGERNAVGNRLSDAERLTAFGLILRSTSLDELPELFNVLKGDISLVGPRPLLMQYLGLLHAKAGPALGGRWAANGFGTFR